MAEFWKKDPKEIKKIWQCGKRGVDAAVNFTRHNAGFESSEWLPLLSTLIPLAAYFEHNKSITGDVERGLLKWF